MDNTEEIQYELTFPGPQRLFYVADAIRSGWSLEKIYKLTKIDYWFLDQINEIIAIEKNLSNLTLNDLDENQILHIK